MELNPNNPTTKAVHAQWHKLCALLMHKLKLDHVVITPDDLVQLIDVPGGVNITVREDIEGIHLRLVGDAQAARLLVMGARPKEDKTGGSELLS